MFKNFMKLKCPNNCKVKSKARFYQLWHVDILYNNSGKDIGPNETSWDTKEESFHCVKCHEEAIEVKIKSEGNCK